MMADEFMDGLEEEGGMDQHARRESARLRQINIGKARPEYKRYLEEVPKEEREPAHPMTPDPRTKASKRQFDRELSAWRRQLHEWDPEEGEEGEESPAAAGSPAAGGLAAAGSPAASKEEAVTPAPAPAARRLRLSEHFPGPAEPLPDQAMRRPPGTHQAPWQAAFEGFSPMSVSTASPAAMTPVMHRHHANPFGIVHQGIPEHSMTPDYKPSMPQLGMGMQFPQDKLSVGYSMMVMPPAVAQDAAFQMSRLPQQYSQPPPPPPARPPQQLWPAVSEQGERKPARAESLPPPLPSDLVEEGRAPSEPRTPRAGDRGAEEAWPSPCAWASPTPWASPKRGLLGASPPSAVRTPNRRLMVPETPSPGYSFHSSLWPGFQSAHGAEGTLGHLAPPPLPVQELFGYPCR